MLRAVAKASYHNVMQRGREFTSRCAHRPVLQFSAHFGESREIRGCERHLRHHPGQPRFFEHYGRWLFDSCKGSSVFDKHIINVEQPIASARRIGMRTFHLPIQ
jgi:hypothetical protein